MPLGTAGRFRIPAVLTSCPFLQRMLLRALIQVSLIQGSRKYILFQAAVCLATVQFLKKGEQRLLKHTLANG